MRVRRKSGKPRSGACETTRRYSTLHSTSTYSFHGSQFGQATYVGENPQYQSIDQKGQNSPSPMAPQFGPIPSPPPGSAVRRHQSLTYGTATQRMASAGLRRAGTLQNQGRTHGHQPQTPSPTGADEEFAEGSTGHDDESYFDRQVS